MRPLRNGADCISWAPIPGRRAVNPNGAHLDITQKTGEPESDLGCQPRQIAAAADNDSGGRIPDRHCVSEFDGESAKERSPEYIVVGGNRIQSLGA